MDKQTFLGILEGAILSFEGTSEAEIIERYGLDPKITEIGLKLCNYLRSIKLKEEV